MRELSREQQLGWVERIFSRLAASFGAAFGRQWDGTNLSEVKATWAEKLGGFTAPQISEALKACEEVKSDGRAYPPNLPEFIEFCRNAARRSGTVALLTPPTLSKEEAEARIREVSQKVGQLPERNPRAWAHELRARYLAGDRLLPVQIGSASEALNEIWENGKCRGVIAEGGMECQ